MVAVPQSQPSSAQRPASRRPASRRPFEVIQGSLSARRVARKSPLLAGLHRTADGSLIGVFAAVLVLSGLTLHWQHRWTLAFRQLEMTREQAHRLTESTAMLERHLLERSQTPKQMVPTTVANLVYLDRPSSASTKPGIDHLAMLGSLLERTIHHGY
ncbi:putative conserved membrane protein [Synechococcus sp. MIT S9220]|uniref:hypothetical protein n=1 Tax=unclassified Synechococcus TaxID=2626047 RepID=UPI00164B6FC6|nr:hypothetical protein [Synechococcus sp. MIT S9220]NOL46386.1 hypothetical protein [Synechococcus sp. MIT S9220]QNJ23512.1 putative conserved membrane protein [Synechococcus sp. MIT S9220]